MKMLKLIQNETIKTFKKTSTKILIILAIVSLLGAVGLAKLVMAISELPGYYMENNENWKEDMKERIASMKKTLETEGMHYDKESLASLKAELETCELALKFDINYMYIYDNFNWKMQLLNEIQDTKLENLLNGGTKSEKIIEDKISLLEKNDYNGYIRFLKENKKLEFDNKKITKEEYDDEIYLLEIQSKYEIFKESTDMFNWKSSLYSDIKAIKENLRTGIDNRTGKLLNLDEIAKLEDNLKIAEYRFEHNIPVQSSGASGRAMYDMFAPAFSLGLISILMIMIAGSSISTEISKGTIKFLLFTPNKRWKVLLSKIISAVVILLVLTIITSIISVILGNIFFKEEATIYVYASNGVVKAIPNMLYTMLYFLTSSIDILVYMIFAFMLSTVTRNTALTVGVSIACYIGSGIIMSLINQFITADWLKFIPFNNLGLADKIFANNISYLAMQNASSMLNNVSIGFSLSVLLVCIILMLITMFDSFNKRDIV